MRVKASLRRDGETVATKLGHPSGRGRQLNDSRLSGGDEGTRGGRDGEKMKRRRDEETERRREDEETKRRRDAVARCARVPESRCLSVSLSLCLLLSLSLSLSLSLRLFSAPNFHFPRNRLQCFRQFQSIMKIGFDTVPRKDPSWCYPANKRVPIPSVAMCPAAAGRNPRAVCCLLRCLCWAWRRGGIFPEGDPSPLKPPRPPPATRRRSWHPFWGQLPRPQVVCRPGRHRLARLPRRRRPRRVFPPPILRP